VQSAIAAFALRSGELAAVVAAARGEVNNAAERVARWRIV
jgi:hypothetical protein